MKNILLLVHDDEGQEARLQAALDVVQAVDGHLTCLDVQHLMIVVGDYFSAAGQGAVIAEERAIEAENRTRTEGRLAREDVRWDWIDAVGDLSDTLARSSTLADLIVLNLQFEETRFPGMKGIVSDVVLRTRKPVLAVPAARRAIPLGGVAAVAWDGSAPAEAAMRAAIPLLKLAEAVAIVEIDNGGITAPAEEAATYLSRHGIAATVRRSRIAHGDKIVPHLLSEIAMAKADYLVMGAYGHGRLREAIFGGVTRTLLTDSPVPLLLAH